MMNGIIACAGYAPITQAVQMLAWLATTGAFLWGLHRWLAEKKVEHAKFLSNLLASLRTKENLETFYLIDYEDANWYNKEFHGSAKEAEVDALLAKLSYLCYLSEEKIIEELEVAAFKYEIQRCLKNSQVVNYLYNIHHYARLNDKTCSPFFHLEEYGKKHAFIDSNDFDNPDSWKTNSAFTNYLGW